MLRALSIKNYALIEALHVDFSNGFSIITGETGAGKSILLGALGLVLGKRADSSYLKNTDTKCIVEAQFEIDTAQLKSFFKAHDLDLESETIIRREILPSGKSRAFVNDTPTTLQVLTALSEVLIDVHSQHQTLSLSNTDFQFAVIDAMAANKLHLKQYHINLTAFKELTTELAELKEQNRKDKLQYDYNVHLLNELDAAALKSDEQQQIEQELDQLNNAEAIKLNLSEVGQLLNHDELGIVNLLASAKSKIQQITAYSETYAQFYERLLSSEIELKDIAGEIERLNEHVVYNPTEIERLNDRLQLIYDLLKKHTALTVDELLQIQSELNEKVESIALTQDTILAKSAEVEELNRALKEKAAVIHKNRIATIPAFLEQLHESLKHLGMPDAQFQFQLQPQEHFFLNGMDTLEVLFSANKGVHFGLLKKIASGGELSRIMLSVKAILSKYSKLPTIIFDEIDTGVSGEIAHKMAAIMHDMSENMQVISITHLPQIAAKGMQHYKVYKEADNQGVTTKLVQISGAERIEEIAAMLGGKNRSESALNHAKELLN